MIGPILLAVSWILLRAEGKGLGALGLNAPGLRLRQFAIGFLVAGTVAALQQIGLSLAAGVPWQFNPAVDAGLIWRSLRWNMVSYLAFSGGPLGRAILVPANGAARMEATGLADFLLDIGLPLMLPFLVSWYLVRGQPGDGTASAVLARSPA